MNGLYRACRLRKLTNYNNIRSLQHLNNRFLTTESPKDDSSTQSSFNEESLRKKILENSLKFVPELGFSREAISQGVAEAGLSEASTNGIFKNGSFDLIDFFYKKSNADLSDYLSELIKAGEIKKKNELVRLAIIRRLELTQPYIKHWPEAMAVMTFNPSYALQSVENLLRLCDEIWYQLGDQSTDINWYSKRLILAGIYKSTEFFMLQDKSENYSDTIKFLDNRLRDHGEFHKFKGQLDNFGNAITGGLSVLKNVLNIRN